jgi:hypothetical protein
VAGDTGAGAPAEALRGWCCWSPPPGG